MNEIERATSLTSGLQELQSYRTNTSAAPPCVVYSFGCNNDFVFEDRIKSIALMSCATYTRSIPHVNYQRRVIWRPVRLGNVTEKADTN
jgi:hypothetical protein